MAMLNNQMVNIMIMMGYDDMITGIFLVAEKTHFSYLCRLSIGSRVDMVMGIVHQESPAVSRIAVDCSEFTAIIVGNNPPIYVYIYIWVCLKMLG